MRYRLEDTVINWGGLFRCCVMNIGAARERAPGNTFTPGSELFCPYCGERVVLDEDGTWNWAPEDEPTIRRS